jgi:hypothetical protein
VVIAKGDDPYTERTATMAKKSERSVEVQDRKTDRDAENKRRNYVNKSILGLLPPDTNEDKRPSKVLRKFRRANNPALDQARADAAQNKAKAVAKAKADAKAKRAQASLALERDVLTAIHHASEKEYAYTDSMHLINDV